MAWEDVELAARQQAREIEWRGIPGGETVGMVGRTVRRFLGRPTDHPIHHDVASRLVMVVPTAGGQDVEGRDRTFGWAVRLTEQGRLEYLRWQAFGVPDWQARLPFQEHELLPLTPGADHWGELDAGQRVKTDLDWSRTHQVPVKSAHSDHSWQIVPTMGTGPRRVGDRLIAALRELPRHEHPILDALPGGHAITP